MELQELTKVEKVSQTIQLVKGEFTLSEASHIIGSLINEKINFHKLQRLQILEGDHKCKTKQLDGRIRELEKEKEIARKYIASLRAHNTTLSIEGVLKITTAK